MRKISRGLLPAIVVAGLAVAYLAPATAQNYPTRAITLIVPAAAGGPTDAIARLIAESMTRTLGQQIVVENAGGAGGTIGMARVAKAAPDGYTISVWHIAQATAPSLYKDLRYNVIDDFDSIGRIADAPMTVVGKTALEAKTIKDLIAWIKTNKATATYAHAGIGSASHLCGLMFLHAINTQLTAVSYRGTGPAMTDLLGGQFDLMCDQTTATTTQIKAGKIKAYAATTKQRLPILPDLPTLDESGLKGFEVSAWHAMWAPKGLPPEVGQKLTAALQAAVKDASVRERMATLGVDPVSPEQATPQALAAHLKAEVAKWSPVIDAAGVKAN
ncbi:MAG TPA: tripartite tricarboxylate transporter substrate-binding protein [Pseudolabrys sp.]|nr:tripartite tricarboxylate transporter substrate-binding protein [Pseudolabrys sp.]